MTSFITSVLSNNLFEKCVNESFNNLNCILGASTFIFGIFIACFNCYAFYKLINFFHKVNFETSLILLNIIQLLLIQLLIITSYELLLECFISVQIILVTWIIRKFNILLKNSNESFKINCFFIFMNAINILLIAFYIILLFLEEFKDFHYAIILTHTCYSLISSCILVIFSCSLLNKLKKINDIEKESLQLVLDYPEESNNELIIKKDSEDPNHAKDFIFYYKREGQIKPLYKINIICTFLEFTFVLSVLLLPNIRFKQFSYKIIPESILSYVFYYVFICICIINTFVNFFCFFWRIKSQYKTHLKTKKKILNNNYLNRKKLDIESENNEPFIIKNFIENDCEKKDNIKKDKNLFDGSFEDLSLDGQDNNIMNQSKEKINDFLSDDNYDVKEKKFKDLLNNENINRESITLDIDSQNGINRISQNTMSIIDEEK